ncbi:arylsulfatase [Pseudonocardia nematodicida]|uniref:Arylsulfatase n=1 Tax=Pseudonocardia nematodicida TaxID=1206997 RepID=A0ABV1KCS6_9PSEU
MVDDRPNVVIVFADDMGWGDLGCNGATAIPTPHMDRLAAEGVRLTDAHASSAMCTPSRYSLLTGRYSWRGPLKHRVLMGHSPSIVEPSRSTTASMLRDGGYATAAIGKWHLGLNWRWDDGTVLDGFAPDAPLFLDADTDSGERIDYAAGFTGGPVDLGFDSFFGIAGSLDMAPYTFLRQDGVDDLPVKPKVEYATAQRPGLQSEDWQDDQVDVRFAEEAVSWIREDRPKDRPFFLYFATAAPHRPCVPPDFVAGRSQAGLRGDSVCLVDWCVGEIMSALEAEGIADNTLIIVSSDNGAPLIFPEDGDVVGHLPNGPYRGQKGDIWDGGHREPFVARWPRRLPAGRTVTDLLCLTDVYPTLASAAGLPVPVGAAEDGVDALGLLTGEVPADEGRTVVHHSREGRFAIRRGRWKAVYCTDSGGGLSAPVEEFSPGILSRRAEPFDRDHPEGQLYDVENDPSEQDNLWDSEPALVRELYRDLCDIVREESNGLPFDALPREQVGSGA